MTARQALASVFTHAVAQTRGEILIEKHCRLVGQTFHCTLPQQRLQCDLPAVGQGRVIVVGAGKAVASLGLGMQKLLGERIDASCLIVKHQHALDALQLEQHEAGHPLPDAAGVAATHKLLDTVRDLTADDLVFVLLTGGASALLVAPVDGIGLQEKIQVNELLIHSGADIHDINTVRRHLSKVKGGGLLQALAPAKAVALLISDVPGNDPAVIGSGPLYPDTRDSAHALQVLEKHGLMNRLPHAVVEHLRAAPTLPAALPPPPHLILGDNQTMVNAACEQARTLGIEPQVFDTQLHGNTHDCAQRFSRALQAAAEQLTPTSPPLLLIGAGETTLQVRGGGKGGRNQEFALVAAAALAGIPSCAILAAGSDGTDGPTDAAGGFADGSSMKRADEQGQRWQDCLDDNDSYTLLQQLGDLYSCGPTGTNVMDLVLGLALPPSLTPP